MSESSDEIVTKSSQISEFTDNIRNLIENATVWYTGSSNPGVGFPTHILGGGQDPGGPSTSELPSAAIDATILANAFHSWSRQYTRVRKLRFRRTGNLSPYDNTEITHLDDNYRQPDKYTDIDNTAVQNNVASGRPIDASNFNDFIDAIYTKWLSHKNDTVTYTFNYCHSSCHSSCHGSGRGRR